MPGKEAFNSVTIAESPVLGSLKAHKPLPRNESQDTRPKRESSTRARKLPTDTRNRKRGGYTTNEDIRSWIPESKHAGALPVVAQPLTPPINLRDTFQSWIDDNVLQHQSFAHRNIKLGTTPLVQQSPPTPETTPEKVHKSSTVDTFKSLRDSSDTLGDQYRQNLESRTESFKTARENLSSEDELDSEGSPSLRASRQRWLRDTGLSKSGGIGLGLGLEPEDENLLTPREPTLQQPVSKSEDFVTFNGVWGSNTPSAMDDTESQTTALRRSDKEETNSRTTEQGERRLELTTSSPKVDSLVKQRDETNSTESERDLASNHRSSAEKVQNDSVDSTDDQELDAEIQDISKNRLSQASTTSTVVEAMVIDSTPRRRRTLRHTGKFVGLESPHSNRGPLTPNEHSVHHRLRNVKSPPSNLRQSFATETMNEEKVRKTDTESEMSSLTIIPDRRASVQSSANSSKRMSRTFSVNSQQQSSRPTTAPEDGMGYFDIPRRERKFVSVLIQQAKPLRHEISVPEKTLSSPIATESAATAASHELSRSDSVTSGGLRTHYIPQTPSPGGDVAQTTENQDSKVIDVQRSNSGDWTMSRPRSALVTPFSLRSAHSSTPGTLEVNEATAVSIYPHTNESILVIQEMAGKDESSPREQSTIIAGNASIALPGPISSSAQPNSSSSLPRVMNPSSPLQNPRDPPKPPGPAPDFKIIPPTPANAPSSTDDLAQNPRRSTRHSRLSAPMASLRRAVSARRYSESIVSPFARTLSLRQTNARRRPHTAEDESTKLHPLWRPRTFWDGVTGSDSDSEFGNDGFLSPQRSRTTSSQTPQRSMSLPRRLTGPLRSVSMSRQRRSSFASQSNVPHYSAQAYTDSGTVPKRASSLSQRLGESFRVPIHRRSRQSPRTDWHNQSNYEFVQPDRGKSDEVPRQGYQVQFIGFRGLAERLERRRESKEEGKREERRNWLRGRIGLVGPTKDITDFDIIHPVRSASGSRSVR